MTDRLTLIAAMLAVPAHAAADGEPYVYDGDYYRGPDGTVWRLTLDHIDESFDAPEINGDCLAERMLARIARDRLRELVERRDGEPVPNGERIPKRGGGYRLVGMLYVDGMNVGDVLLGEELVVRTWRHEGFKGGEWCR